MSDLELQKGDVLLSQYRLDGLLGRGGMGEVWRALDLRLKRTVAIKVMLPELGEDAGYVESFQREMENVAKLKHENVCRVYTGGVIERGGDVLLYMVMELVEGQPLSLKLRLAPRFDAVTACYTAFQIAEALQAAHEKNIIHRDIKPENVIVSKKGHVTVVDFGIAKRRGTTREPGRAAGGAARTTRPIGTPRYMSPEQIRGGEIDARSDQYALGVVLYLMLASDFPFPGLDDDDETAILRAHLEDDPQPLSDVLPTVEPTLEALVMRLLGKRPEDRFQDATVVMAKLDSFIRGSIPPGHPVADRLAQERKSIARKAVYERTRSSLAGASPNEAPRPQLPGLPPPVDVTPSRPASLPPPPAMVPPKPAMVEPPLVAPLDMDDEATRRDPTSPWAREVARLRQDKTLPLPAGYTPRPALPAPRAPRVSSSASGGSWTNKRATGMPGLRRAARQLAAAVSLGVLAGGGAGGVVLAARAAMRRSSAATAAPSVTSVTAAPSVTVAPSATVTSRVTAAPSVTVSAPSMTAAPAASVTAAAPSVTARVPAVVRVPTPRPAETAKPVETAKPAEVAKPRRSSGRVFGSWEEDEAAKPAETPKPPPSAKPEP